MTHTQYGNFVNTGMDAEIGEGTEGMLEMQHSLFVTEVSAMPTGIALGKKENLLIAGSEEGGEILVLNMSGDVLGTKDTLGVACIIPWLDAGRLVAIILDAAKRAPGPHGAMDFVTGMREIERLADDSSVNKAGDS